MIIVIIPIFIGLGLFIWQLVIFIGQFNAHRSLSLPCNCESLPMKFKDFINYYNADPDNFRYKAYDRYSYSDFKSHEIIYDMNKGSDYLIWFSNPIDFQKFRLWIYFHLKEKYEIKNTENALKMAIQCQANATKRVAKAEQERDEAMQKALNEIEKLTKR